MAMILSTRNKYSSVKAIYNCWIIINAFTRVGNVVLVLYFYSSIPQSVIVVVPTRFSVGSLPHLTVTRSLYTLAFARIVVSYMVKFFLLVLVLYL